MRKFADIFMSMIEGIFGGKRKLDEPKSFLSKNVWVYYEKGKK